MSGIAAGPAGHQPALVGFPRLWEKKLCKPRLLARKTLPPPGRAIGQDGVCLCRGDSKPAFLPSVYSVSAILTRLSKP